VEAGTLNTPIFLPVGKAEELAVVKRTASILGATVATGKRVLVIDCWRIKFVQS